VSAFDDEFGLFGDDEPTPDEERKPTLGARQIASGETIIDDIEPEDERPARRRPSAASAGQRERPTGERRPYQDRDHGPRTTGDPAVAQARAVELLRYLAQKLVSKPDAVIVTVVDGPRGPVIELEVHPDDFGKVIGKGGRVAQALRTIVRASAEGKVTIDIVDVEDDEPDTAPEIVGDSAVAVDDVEVAGSVQLDDVEADADDTLEADAPVAEAPAVKKPAARKKRATAPVKRKKSS
jgi:predicted RNA-binding protein YlqC (UPF0109 family)